MRRLAGPAAIACAVAAALAGPTPSAAPAGATSAAAAAAAARENRAVVIVDTGREVRRVCVRFAEDFLTGQELLVRAGTDPVFRQYSGLGAAVCALCGVGCPADESCLTCGGDTHWSYSRAPKGTSQFRLSGGGASNSKVYDGDVEGWRWSKGLLPAFASVEQVCGPAPGAGTTSTVASAAVTDTSAPPTTVASSPPQTATAPTGARDASRAAGAAPGSTTTTTPAPALVTTTTTAGAAQEDDAQEEEEATPPTVPTAADAGGGTALSMLGFAAALAALIGWAAWLRRRGRLRTD